jgi:hypothetical protein
MPHHNMHHRHARAAFPDPEAIANAAANAFAEAAPQETLVSVVYVTASKTFDGPVGGYTTLGVPAAPSEDANTPDAATQAPAAPTTQAPVAATTEAQAAPATPSTTNTPKAETPSQANTAIAVDTRTSAKSSAAHTTLRTSSGLPASIVPTSSVATSLAIAVATTSLSSTPHHSSTLTSTASQASSTSTESSSSGGMSSAGKAGLAVGLLLLFGTVLALVIFFFRKRKAEAEREKLDDEKTEIFGGAGRQASTRTAANAPRLSLRPVTQFLPNLGEKRQSKGNALAMASPATPAKNGSGWERPMLSQESNRNNPFGNHAETIDATNANGPTVVNSVGPGGEIVAGAATGAAAAGAIGLARGASKREGQPKQIDFTKGGPFKAPPSPSGTDFSVSSEAPGTSTQGASRSGAAIAAAGGPTNSAVHRVQLDFKPSMEDELELRAGQLIRMLHEYDDGWVSQVFQCHKTMLTLVGSLHSSRSLPTRCLPQNLSFNPSRQASSPAKRQRSSWPTSSRHARPQPRSSRSSHVPSYEPRSPNLTRHEPRSSRGPG